MTRRAALPILVLLALSACAERPFVDAFPAELALLPADALEFDVCHAPGADPAEIRRLAQETCAERQMRATPLYTSRWQCRVTTPHLTRFKCM